MITTKDTQALEQAARLIIDVLERHRIIDEDAAERRALFTVSSGAAGFTASSGAAGSKVIPFTLPNKKADAGGASGTDEGVFKFTEKEILKMPKQFRQHFRTCGLTAHIRQIRGVYEIRYRRDGYNISASHKTLAIAKEKFIVALTLADKAKKEQALSPAPVVELKPSATIDFVEYMLTWLETVKRPAVKKTTFNDYMWLFNYHVLRDFAGCKLADVTRQKLQDVINVHVENGHGRTAKKMFQLLKAVLNVAVADELLNRNPAEYVSLPRYEEVKGTALTMQEERAFIERARQTPHFIGLMILLYTGMRRSELASAKIDASGNWIVVVSAKQRKGVIEKTRRIPITPMLRKILPVIDLDDARKVHCHTYTTILPKLAPGHHCHDLRHTFITRCQECGVPREVVSIWAGHKADNTMTSNVYTHLSPEYQLKESQKVLY